jgi:putative ABC transport system permease protein
VSPAYFETLRIPLLRGRLISESDTADAPPVCVIDSSLAKRFFRNEDPIGQAIEMYSGGARIVGIVSAVRHATLESTSRPVVYYPLAQIPYFQKSVSLFAPRCLPHLSSGMQFTGLTQPAFDIKTMENRIDASLAVRAVIAWLVSVFAAISVLLAALGIHGVITQVVTERTAEIGNPDGLGSAVERCLQALRHART